MKTKLFSILFISAFMLGCLHFTSCGAGGTDKEKALEPTPKDNYYQEGEKGDVSEEMAKDAPSTADQSTDSKTTVSSSSTGDANTGSEKIPVEKTPSKIIKKAEISLQVKDYKESRTNFLKMVKASGAYISTENQSNTSGSIIDDMEIRIKPSGFDSLVELILAEAIYVDYSNITADDVTEEYVDAEARLKAKEDVQAQYKEILKKANNISEIMSVQEKINQIQEEMDAYQAKLKFMDDKVSYSTIKLHFYEKFDEISAPDTGFWHKTGKAFKTGWHGLQMFFIGFIYLWPLWLIALISLYLVFFFIKRRRKRNAGKI